MSRPSPPEVVHEETLEQNAAQQELARERSRGVKITARPVPGYELQHELGRGAYGEVWLAIDRNTGRKVAIKFFSSHKGLDWPLLKREVDKLVQVVGERRIVHLLKVGWDADPPYYVMEYLEGGSLADRMHDGPLSVRNAVRWFWEVAQALAYLHGKAILHCDLKPANVLLDEGGQIRLADFGQARLSHESGPALGTLFYMAPEQLEAQAKPDVRSDIYSLGALLYAMLTGKPPYATEEASRQLASGDTVSDRLARYREIVEQSPFPDAHHQLPEVDGALTAILDRCLNHDPRERFENVQQLLDALKARFRARQQRPLLIFSLLGPAIVLLALVAIGLWAESEGSRSARKTLTRQLLKDHRESARVMAAAVDRHLSAALRRVERESRHDPLRQELLALEKAAGAGGNQHLASLRQHLDDLYEAYKDRHFYSWVLASSDAKTLVRAPHGVSAIQEDAFEHEWFHGATETSESEAIAPRQQGGLTLAYRGPAPSHPILLAVAAPVRAEKAREHLWDDEVGSGRIIGVLAATLELGTFNKWLDQAEESPAEDGCPDRFTVLMHRDQLVRHPCVAVGLPSPPLAAPEFHDQAAVWRLMMTDTGSTADYADPLRPGQVYLAAWCRLEQNPKWMVIVQQVKSEALRPIDELVERFGLMARIAAAIGLAIVATLWFLILRMTRQATRGQVSQ